MRARADATDDVSEVAAGRDVGPVPIARRFRRAENWLLVVGLLAKVWVLALAYFRDDDWIVMQQAIERGLTPALLLQDYNGHVMPLFFATVWAFTTVAPYNFAVAAAPVLAMLALTYVVFALLVRRLVDPGWGRLAAVALFAVGTLSLDAVQWLSAGLQVVPMQLAIVLMLYCTARYFDGGRWWLLGVAAAYAAGLAFWEKSLLAVIPALGLAVVLRSEGLTRTQHFGRRLSGLLASLSVISGLYLAFYLTYSTGSRPTPPSLRAGISTAVDGALNGLVPALVGGPWRDRGDALNVFVDLSGAAVGLSLLIVVAVVAVSIMAKGRRAALAWSVPLVYLLVEVALVTVARGGSLEIIGRDRRYYGEAVVVVATFFALAYRDVTRARFREVTAAPRWVLHPWAPLACLAVFLLSCFQTTWGLGQAAHANPTRSFVENARAQLAGMDRPVLFDGGAPPGVVSPLLFTGGRVSPFLAGIPVRYDEPTDRLYMLDGDGDVVRAGVGTAFDSFVGPVPSCGWLVTNSSTRVGMSQQGFSGDWGIRIRYLAEEAGPLRVRVGEAQYVAPLSKGLGETYLVHRGTPAPITMRALTPGVTVCVDQVRVGDIRPLDGLPESSR